MVNGKKRGAVFALGALLVAVGSFGGAGRGVDKPAAGPTTGDTIESGSIALQLQGAATAVPKAQTYTHATNPWRGETVSQMATNQQWEVYRNTTGTLLVRLLYNEKESTSGRRARRRGICRTRTSTSTTP